jgi:hypothetical protein
MHIKNYGETMTEQEFYEFLKGLSNDILVERVKQIEISRHNQDIELNMLHNLLINRGVGISGNYIRDFEYRKFYQKGDELI